MSEYKVSADALVEKDGEYLMVQEGKEHVDGTWSMPGGGLEGLENPAEAVRRELREETGLETKSVDGLIGVYYSRSETDGGPVLVMVFSCGVEDGDPEPMTAYQDEVRGARFFSEKEIEYLELRNDIIERAIEDRVQRTPLDPGVISKFMHPHREDEPSPQVSNHED
ncbi:MAG: NUDIX hydrolase [Candidatus Nanohaloarchaea archaeon]